MLIFDCCCCCCCFCFCLFNKHRLKLSSHPINPTYPARGGRKQKSNKSLCSTLWQHTGSYCLLLTGSIPAYATWRSRLRVAATPLIYEVLYLTSFSSMHPPFHTILSVPVNTHRKKRLVSHSGVAHDTCVVLIETVHLDAPFPCMRLSFLSFSFLGFPGAGSFWHT